MKITRINQNYTQKNPSFNADIRLVRSGGEFLTIAKGLRSVEVCRVTNKFFNIEEAAVMQRAAYTLRVFDCLAGSIINPETCLLNMFHLSPYENTMPRLEKVLGTIYRQAERLKGKTKTPLEGFIAGGDNSSDSKRLFEGIKNIFDEIAKDLGMDYSIIALRKFSFGVDLASDARTGTHYLHLKPCYCKEPEWLKQNAYNYLGKYRRIVISPSDTLFGIDGDDISAKYKKPLQVVA
ncbi:MAG: hypothetical protein PHC64_01290 [Candidatus Gastranaerophilales bacterium]|nr:hypothetical protein [Candidatus Gastranaerophilales bacterium]